MIRMKLCWLGIVLGLVSANAGAQDWNQWRGPNRDARVTGFTAPKVWPKELTKRWSVDVGVGHASPIIAGGKVYVFSRVGDDEITRSLDLQTGKELWKTSYSAPYEMHPAARGHGKGPKSTPTYTDGRLYTFGISGILSCLEANTGKVIWRHEYAKEYKATSPAFGVSVSPLVDNGSVIVHVGGAGDGAVTAYDAKTGSQRWQWKGDGPAYASPMPFVAEGTRQIITQTQKMCISLDAVSGKLLWSIPFTTPFEQNVITPIIVKDVVIFAGIQQPALAVRAKKTGDTWSTEKVWESRDINLYMNTPAVGGDRLYGMSMKMRGQLFTLDAMTGKTLWSDQGRFGENASVYDAGSVVLALNTEADLHVYLKDGDTLKETAKYAVAQSPTWASPAIQGRQILVKDLNSLTLWEIPK